MTPDKNFLSDKVNNLLTTIKNHMVKFKIDTIIYNFKLKLCVIF